MRERREIKVQGIVQGVGFRPCVYGLARRFGLAGRVRNDTTGLVIDVEGDRTSLDTFLQALVTEAPPLAVIERVVTARKPIQHYTTFAIDRSVPQAEKEALIAPDVATCPACLGELTDPADRRYHYPFLNCTNCGPRFTIITDVPYDRERTTMRGFAMCPACQAEYADPGDRRFHAQPTACPVCGPRLWVSDGTGRELLLPEPLAFISARLQRGDVVAIKGLGGYHLCCDALHEAAVRELRRRKQREAKPLAVMVPDLDTARRYSEVQPLEAAVLTSPRRPIVLLRKRQDDALAEAVAPRQGYLGVMLPYTPLHHLLMRQVARPLVMTSGNRSEEPIAYADSDAVHRLAGIADAFLMHNRPIHTRCDDSVTRVVLGRELLLRRARGYAPRPIRLATPCAIPLLACGGQMKNTFCLARGEHAFLSHHIGDLDDSRTYGAFVEGIAHFQRLLGITPAAVAHDLHPGYLSSQFARSLPGLPHIAVQHHHAHIASCMVENNCEAPVIGVAWDGTGYGTDGRLWGGEFLVATYAHCERLAHLEEVPLPGGEQAIRQPWRMAVAYLYRAYGEAMADLGLAVTRRLDSQTWRIMHQMLAREINSPLTSSAGRLCDAIAALIGLRHEARYEAQAAMELEMIAGETPAPAYPFGIRRTDRPMVVETQGIITGVVADLQTGQGASYIAAKFHSTLAEIILETCRQIRGMTGLARVALSGGVFQNMRLLTEAVSRLTQDGFAVYTHSQIPPNDGGIALGQIAVANAMLRQGRPEGQMLCA
jgi:hydrogenase maturation protein HypF